MAPKLIPNATWLRITQAILDGDSAARGTLRSQITFYIQYVMKLTLGPQDDADRVRRRIAIAVIWDLEADEFAALRAWRARQARGIDTASWWPWITAMARFAAVRRTGADRAVAVRSEAKLYDLFRAYRTPDDSEPHEFGEGTAVGAASGPRLGAGKSR